MSFAIPVVTAANISSILIYIIEEHDSSEL